MTQPSPLSRFRGCMLAGAVGDALGALHGVEAIPRRWLDQLDLRDVVDTVATDLYRSCHEPEALDEMGTYDFERYSSL